MQNGHRPFQIECAPTVSGPLQLISKFLKLSTELKKDPSVPRLPNLKTLSAEKQCRRFVCPPYCYNICLGLTLDTLVCVPHLSLPRNLP